MQNSKEFDKVFLAKLTLDFLFAIMNPIDTKGAAVMKYLRQMRLIFLFSLLGELCRYLIPYPIPASIYGIALLVAALALKIIPVSAVSDAGDFLVSLLPLLFVAPTVNILESWGLIKNDIIVILVILVVAVIVSFAASGLVTQWLIRKQEGRGNA